MIEPIMYVGIGFLVAGLLVIGVIPLVHARAVRLTMRRLEALTPLSMAEIQADKDQLRAEFAMSMSRLEMNVEQMKAKTTSQARRDRQEERGDRPALSPSSARNRGAVRARSQAKGSWPTMSERSRASSRPERARCRRPKARSRMRRPNSPGSAPTSNKSTLSSDTQRVELAAAAGTGRAPAGSRRWLRQRDQGAAGSPEHTRPPRPRRRGNSSPGSAAGLTSWAPASANSSVSSSRRPRKRKFWRAASRELGTQLEEQGRFLTDYENASDRLRTEAMSAQESESTLRAELAELEGRYRLAIDTVTTEKSLIESELKRSHDERAKLQRDIAAMRRDAENGGANVRKENAVLRESINDVAAEVARLTATLEGPDSAHCCDPRWRRRPTGGERGEWSTPARTPRTGESKDTLADRIRTLQGGASRAAPASEPARGPARNARR